jgi:hypothetical protein
LEALPTTAGEDDETAHLRPLFCKFNVRNDADKKIIRTFAARLIEKAYDYNDSTNTHWSGGMV